MANTITATTIKADGIPAADKVTSDDIGGQYLAAATSEAKSAQAAMAKGQARLATVVYQVKTSGIARFGLTADQLEASDDDGRATGFSLWYRSLGMTMQEADKLANFGRYLASGLPVANVGQARAIIALENAGENDQAWRDQVRSAVADVYSEAKADKVRPTAAAIRAKASEALGIKDKRPAKAKASETSDQRPAAKVETLADFARFVASDVTAAAASVSGDLSGFTHSEWKAFAAKLADLQEAADRYRLKADREATADSV